MDRGVWQAIINPWDHRVRHDKATNTARQLHLENILKCRLSTDGPWPACPWSVPWPWVWQHPLPSGEMKDCVQHSAPWQPLTRSPVKQPPAHTDTLLPHGVRDSRDPPCVGPVVHTLVKLSHFPSGTPWKRHTVTQMGKPRPSKAKEFLQGKPQ